VLIALVGIEYTHKDLKDNYVSTWDVLPIILWRKIIANIMFTSEFHWNKVVQYRNVQNLGVMLLFVITIKKFLVSLRQS